MAKVAVVGPERAREVASVAGQAGTGKLRAYVDGAGNSIHLHLAELGAGESVTVGPMAGDCAAYVWQGAVSAGGAALDMGSSAIVERGAVLEALAESEDAMTSLVKREDQLRALDVALDAGRRTQGSVDQAYQAGAASRIDALLAEAQALSAEGADIDARQETARAAVASFRALGGGWSAQAAH